jgi:hypothetical protein
VSLSDDERDRLLEIETLTAAQDPGFVARLDLDATVRRRRLLRPLCWCLLALGGLLVIGGAGAAQGLISIGTVAAAGGGTLMIWAAVTVRRLRVVRRPTGTDPG